jgi:guanylate kinase
VLIVQSASWEALPGRLCVVSGPSGVGKSTLCRKLVASQNVRARLSVSATTRPPRSGERNAVDYYFLTHAEFDRMRARGELLESAEVHGNLYGTPITPVRENLAEGFCVILVIDVQGGLQVLQRVPNALLVFVNAPSLDVLEARLRARSTDNDATIERRLDNARREIEQARRFYPIHVLNDNLDEAVADLVALLKQHGCEG